MPPGERTDFSALIGREIETRDALGGPTRGPIRRDVVRSQPPARPLSWWSVRTNTPPRGRGETRHAVRTQHQTKLWFFNNLTSKSLATNLVSTTMATMALTPRLGHTDEGICTFCLGTVSWDPFLSKPTREGRSTFQTLISPDTSLVTDEEPLGLDSWVLGSSGPKI